MLKILTNKKSISPRSAAFVTRNCAPSCFRVTLCVLSHPKADAMEFTH